MMLEGNAFLNSVFLSRGIYKVFHYSRNVFNISKEQSKLHCDKAFLKSGISDHCKAFGNDMVSVPWLPRHVILNIIEFFFKIILNLSVTR